MEPPETAPPARAVPQGSGQTREFALSLPRGRRRWALVWGAVSTVLSVLGFIAYVMFDQYSSSLGELRTDLKRFNETSAEFVKKDAFHRSREQTKARLKELESAHALAEQLGRELRASEKAREETARELQRIRERLAFVEGQHSAQTGRPPGLAGDAAPQQTTGGD